MLVVKLVNNVGYQVGQCNVGFKVIMLVFG